MKKLFEDAAGVKKGLGKTVLLMPRCVVGVEEA